MEETTRIELTGMSWLRVFSACQALTAPSGFYRVTHKRARAVVTEHLGFCPKGKPAAPSRVAILAWLGLTEESSS